MQQDAAGAASRVGTQAQPLLQQCWHLWALLHHCWHPPKQGRREALQTELLMLRSHSQLQDRPRVNSKNQQCYSTSPSPCKEPIPSPKDWIVSPCTAGHNKIVASEWLVHSIQEREEEGKLITLPPWSQVLLPTHTCHPHAVVPHPLSPRNSTSWSSACHWFGWGWLSETEGIHYPSYLPSWHATKPYCKPLKLSVSTCHSITLALLLPRISLDF